MINLLMKNRFLLKEILRQKRWIQNSSKHASQAHWIKKPPVVTIMGHVDHGKTTLLDHLRNSRIVEQEFGGITQHIGAFVVPFKRDNKTEMVTFLDTPGHAAFAAMRERGAKVTDIVVLVIACEDGVLDQTTESIKFAKASDVPIIVAVNKIDKYSDKKELDKNIELVRRQLIVHDVIPEQDGGEVQLIPISALKGIGVEHLKEAILAQADILDLKAELDCPATGSIIEASKHPHRGKLCTILVQRGQLLKGDHIVAGTSNWAKVRALFDERNQLRQSCGPGTPIQVTGWREEELPAAGDQVLQVENEKEAKSIIKKYREERRAIWAETNAKAAAEKAQAHQQLYQEKLALKRASTWKGGRIFLTPKGVRPKETLTDGTVANDQKLNLILKCDVDGSLEALLNLLDSYDKDNKQPVQLDIMHYGVGDINDNDYVLATTFPNTVIYGFNVKLANQKILVNAKREGVNLKLFNVIYHLVDDLKARISEKLPELEQEVEIGQASVIQEFVITETKKKKTHVAGCRCSRGLLKKDSLYKLKRNNELIYDNLQVKTLKHLKNDVKEVEKDRECGISFNDDEQVGEFEFKQGDLLIAFERRKYKPKLKWDLKGF